MRAWVGLSSPEASGRTRVRVTCRSKDRSAKSFSTTPALRITKDPVTKMVIGYTRGNVKGKLQVVDLQAEMSGCVVMGGAGTMKVNDGVELVARRATAMGGGR